jgi:hypothetical protein
MSSTVTKAASAVLTLGFEMICGVIFGTPSRNCTGSGICMVTSIGHIRRRKFPCVCVTAYLSMSPEGAIYLQFPTVRRILTAITTCSGRDIFEVDETFRDSPMANESVGKSSIFIPPGATGYAEPRTRGSSSSLFKTSLNHLHLFFLICHFLIS